MRILQVVEPGVDGVFRHVEGLVHFLLNNQVEVDLAYSSVRGSADLLKLVSRVQDCGGRAVDLAIGNSPSLGDLGAWKKLWTIISQRKPDLIHAHSSKAGALVRLMQPLLGKTPIFFTPHAYYAMGGVARLGSGMFEFVEKLLSGIGTTINISQDEADYARSALGIDPEKQRIIHNPVSEAFFADRTPSIQAQARRELQIPEDAMVIGTVARLADQKDPETLYRAFAQVARERRDLVLVHLGEGPLKEKIQQLATELHIADQVFLLKYRDRPITVYEAMDALIMSSRYEAGWPISILEAMAQNLPIITTTCPGCLNIANDRLSHCWPAPVADVEALASAIRSWLADRSNARVCNHREIALERFSTQKCYGAVLEEYRSAVSPQRHGS